MIPGRWLQRTSYGRIPSRTSSYARSVVWGDAGGRIVSDAIEQSSPSVVGRLGSTELAAVSFCERWRSSSRRQLPYPKALRRVLEINAGVFPTDDHTLDRFSEVFTTAISETDVMGVMFHRNEDRIVEQHCPSAKLVQLEAVNPLMLRDPWSALLEGRKVLVIHPFARSIESQYRERRTQLFSNPRVLPEFELVTLKAVQSGAGGKSQHVDWFEALDEMVARAADIEFDIAIIGAGAYGLPLAAAVKRLGRHAVQLGGATQLLFGIRGRRWEVEYPDTIAPLFNEHWIRPSADETPPQSASVERACYW